MSVLIETLPWEAAALPNGEIRWDELRVLAHAVHDDADVRRPFMDSVLQTIDREQEHVGGMPLALEHLGTMAVFALAADGLAGEAADEIGVFFIDVLEQAGKIDDDWMLEWTEYVAGRLGPPILEPALRLIDVKGPSCHSWPFPVNLLKVADRADGDMQQRVLESCRRVIEMADDWEGVSCRADAALWVLLHFEDSDSLPLLYKKRRGSHNHELRAAISILRGDPDSPSPSGEELWDTPIESWLPREIEQLRRVYSHYEEQSEDWAEENDSSRFGSLLHDLLHANTKSNATRSNDHVVRRVGRNDPCPCGSGMKHKKCCARG